MTGVVGMTARRVTSNDAYYVHDQGVPATVWVIVHNLGKHPAIHVEDTAGAEWDGGVVHVSPNQAVVTFNAAFAGKAHCS